MTARGLVVAAALVVALLPEDTAAQGCTYAVTPALDLGVADGLPTPTLDATSIISVTCTNLLAGVINRRVCLSLPPGTGGVSIADRRLTTGPHDLQYQLYADAGRSVVWGELGDATPPLAVDFTGLSLGVPQMQVVTIYGRGFGGQTGQGVGVYQSDLTPVGRWEDYLLGSPPSCQSVTANPTSLDPVTVQATIDPTCAVGATPLDFGTVTTLDGHVASTNLSVTCTLDGAYSIALDGGTVTGDIDDRRMRLGTGPEAIGYQLYQDSGHTQVWGDTPSTTVDGTGTGSSQSFPIYGHVPVQGAKPAGTYRDTITVTVTF